MPDPASVCRREDALLVVVDIQERLAAVMDRRDAVVASVVRLIRTAALVGVPIVVTRQYPKGLGDTDPTVAEALSRSRRPGIGVLGPTRSRSTASQTPGSPESSRASGRSQLVLAGMETHICIAQTALHAVRDGLEVQVAADACCSRHADAHRTAVDRMRAAGAVVTVDGIGHVRARRSGGDRRVPEPASHRQGVTTGSLRREVRRGAHAVRHPRDA